MKAFAPDAIGCVTALFTVLVLALALAGPVAAAAEASDDRLAAADPRVSMSPEQAAATTSSSPSTAPQAESALEPPLTRAAARRRVETISPVPWLARFGPVSLEGRN